MVILIFFVIGQAVDLVIDYGHMTPIVDTHRHIYFLMVGDSPRRHDYLDY
jgi:hypothetical protein